MFPFRVDTILEEARKIAGKTDFFNNLKICNLLQNEGIQHGCSPVNCLHGLKPNYG